MKKSMYYDRKCNKIDQQTWTKLFSDREYQVLAQVEGVDRAVSTVWLGLDHSHGSASFGPVIFETMVFDKLGEEVDCIRSRTEEEAMKYHEKMCTKYINRRDNRFGRIEIE